jgi:hypothetical protein
MLGRNKKSLDQVTENQQSEIRELFIVKCYGAGRIANIMNDRHGKGTFNYSLVIRVLKLFGLHRSRMEAMKVMPACKLSCRNA